MVDEFTSVQDWELVAQVCQAYRSLSDAFIDRIGMHRAQATVLCRLYVQDGMTQSEIGDQLSVQGATITNILQRMEDSGLVTRRRDPDDNRLVRVYLTQSGQENERAITEQFMKLERTVFEGINEDDRALFRRILRQLLHNMGSEGNHQKARHERDPWSK